MTLSIIQSPHAVKVVSSKSMKPLEIIPLVHALNASVCVPGSKSLTNRVLLVGALADGSTRITNALFSDDSHYLVHALQTLGFEVVCDPVHAEMMITGLGGCIPARKAELFIGNAGTAARFLSAFLTLGQGDYILNGDVRMRERPMGDLVAALTQLGGHLDSFNPTATSCISLPLRITAGGLPGGHADVPGDISSQFISALLMVAPYAQNRVEISLTGRLNSKPYVDMTLSVMTDFGVLVQPGSRQSFMISPAHYASPVTYPIESDASAASYFFAAPAICGGKVRVKNISRHSKQGDIDFLDVLDQMGCTITAGEDFIEVTGADCLQGVDMDMCNIPDTAQTLAAIAPFASTPTRIRGVASARVKESNRVSATCTELSRLGVQVEEHPDGMTIYPCKKFRPAIIQTYNDHRMAMAFALIGLRVPGVSIENPACVSKTFPNFFEVLGSLR
jgi:3-phosphoshikimate 1-carboxyvinyltransferase